MRKGKVNRSAGINEAAAIGKHNITTLCSTFHLHVQLSSSLKLLAQTVMLDPTSSVTMSEYTSKEAEPRTPSRSCIDANMRSHPAQEVRRESRVSTLRVDTRVAETLQSASRRVSPSGTTSDSPASSTSNHSRQDSTASYTPLRSARGSLSLGVS